MRKTHDVIGENLHFVDKQTFTNFKITNSEQEHHHTIRTRNVKTRTPSHNEAEHKLWLQSIINSEISCRLDWIGLN
jgi:hypothetical protein